MPSDQLKFIPNGMYCMFLVLYVRDRETHRGSFTNIVRIHKSPYVVLHKLTKEYKHLEFTLVNWAFIKLAEYEGLKISITDEFTLVPNGTADGGSLQSDRGVNDEDGVRS